MTPEQIISDRRLVRQLKTEVADFYMKLFHLKTGGRFHAFVEWCGVMSEHLNLVDKLLISGVDAFDMNQHTGQQLPIPPYQLAYMAEKMECIFDGAIEVRQAGAAPAKVTVPEAVLVTLRAGLAARAETFYANDEIFHDYDEGDRQAFEAEQTAAENWLTIYGQ